MVKSYKASSKGNHRLYQSQVTCFSGNNTLVYIADKIIYFAHITRHRIEIDSSYPDSNIIEFYLLQMKSFILHLLDSPSTLNKEKKRSKGGYGQKLKMLNYPKSSIK
ncbi:hypothetical protein V6Z12_D05G175600 [Gossypium hirsutum]